MRARMLMTLAVATLSAATHGQDSVRLLHTARVEPGRPVLLRDIAALQGPHRDRLGEMVVVQSPGAEPADAAGWFSVGLDRVDLLLDEELGPKAGMVALSGSACSVRVVGPGAECVPEPLPAAPADTSPLFTMATVRGAIARELCRVLGASPDVLRLGFEPGEASFLDAFIEGRVLEISPAGSSPRMPIAVTVHEPSGKMVKRTVRVEIELRRTVAIASRNIERGHGIEAGDIAGEERWLPLGTPSISPRDAVGAVARRRLKPGELLEAQSVEPPVAIERGDRVWVRVVTRGLVVRREGHALEDGREGEEIRFAAVEDSRQQFRAVVTGRGNAAVWAGEVGGGGTGLAISASDD